MAPVLGDDIGPLRLPMVPIHTGEVEMDGWYVPTRTVKQNDSFELRFVSELVPSDDHWKEGDGIVPGTRRLKGYFAPVDANVGKSDTRRFRASCELPFLFLPCKLPAVGSKDVEKVAERRHREYPREDFDGDLANRTGGRYRSAKPLQLFPRFYLLLQCQGFFPSG